MNIYPIIQKKFTEQILNSLSNIYVKNLISNFKKFDFKFQKFVYQTSQNKTIMDSKMNIKDLHEKFPMIKEVQGNMEDDEKITIGQKKAFPRQVENSNILQLLMRKLQIQRKNNKRQKQEIKELKDQIKHMRITIDNYTPNRLD